MRNQRIAASILAILREAAEAPLGVPALSKTTLIAV